MRQMIIHEFLEKLSAILSEIDKQVAAMTHTNDSPNVSDKKKEGKASEEFYWVTSTLHLSQSKKSTKARDEFYQEQLYLVLLLK